MQSTGEQVCKMLCDVAYTCSMFLNFHLELLSCFTLPYAIVPGFLRGTKRDKKLWIAPVIEIENVMENTADIGELHGPYYFLYS